MAGRITEGSRMEIILYGHRSRHLALRNQLNRKYPCFPLQVRKKILSYTSYLLKKGQFLLQQLRLPALPLLQFQRQNKENTYRFFLSTQFGTIKFNYKAYCPNCVIFKCLDGQRYKSTS